MKIEVKKITKEELTKLGVFSWPIWAKEISEFDWFYSDRERCYIIEGAVEVKTDDGIVSFKAGDYVVFPKGLKCIWKITKDVKKHYNFG